MAWVVVDVMYPLVAADRIVVSLFAMWKRHTRRIGSQLARWGYRKRNLAFALSRLTYYCREGVRLSVSICVTGLLDLGSFIHSLLPKHKSTYIMVHVGF